MEKTMVAIKARPLGKTGVNVSRVGLGGEGVLRTFGKSTAAKAVIDEAVRQGITYFDSARAYAGSEGYYGAYWPYHADTRARVFQTSKSASRDRDGAVNDLKTTLRTMGVDHLDLWQIHDVRTVDDIEAIQGEGGALEAFVAAKEEGLIKFIGVTGHYDPKILTYAVEHWPVDTVLLPVNPVEGVIGGFLDGTLPAARKRGLGIIGMKVLGASNYIYRELGITPERLIRYALSQHVSTAIVGCSSPEEVAALAEVGRTHTPMDEEEQQKLISTFRPFAKQLAYYRGDL
ncbi:MAG TPA: aldo/keto reductase [Methanocella sp.]|jgi:aryl-alcohol dehydrogenase-like predicted oxidoreductase